MVERYSREEMASKWTMQAKYQAWLDVELAVVKAWNRLGLIPDEDAEKIVKNAGFSVERIDEIEAVTRHDLIAFTTSVSETLGEESRWFHYGMTSSDTVDTAVALQMTSSLEIIIEDVKMMMESIKKRAMEHKMTLMVGRSHGIHGEPITFGLVLAVWYDEMARHLENLEQTMKVIRVGQISGAMGNFAHAPLELEEYAMEELGLKPAPASNQVIQRDRYARLASALALLASSIEKFAVQVRHWQRPEVYEVEEYFAKGQMVLLPCRTKETLFLRKISQDLRVSSGPMQHRPWRMWHSGMREISHTLPQNVSGFLTHSLPQTSCCTV